MMFGAGLSLDQAPPFKVPYRFFVTAPLAGMAGAVALMMVPEGSVRLSPEVLGAVHLVTIGVFLMIMTGAMMQMLPVIAGAVIPQPLRHGGVIHTLYVTGLAVFSGGLLSGHWDVTVVGAGVLGIGIVYFLWLALGSLRRVHPFSDSVRAFAMALGSLGIAVLAGVAGALTYAGLLPAQEAIGQLHMIWIFFGWIGLLVIGVSFQVVPMFYVASPYPRFCRVWGTALIFGSLLVVAFSLWVLPGVRVVPVAALGLTGGLYVGFAAVTVRRLQKRKRAVKDPTLWFWYTAMGSLGIGMILWYAGWLMDHRVLMESAALILGYGFVLGLMSAMLYKIVPFLIWFHLNAQGHFDIPTMREIVPGRHIRIHYYLFMAGFAVMLPAWWGWIAFSLAGGALAVLFGWWLLPMVRSGRYYFKKAAEAPAFSMTFPK